MDKSNKLPVGSVAINVMLSIIAKLLSNYYILR